MDAMLVPEPQPEAPRKERGARGRFLKGVSPGRPSSYDQAIAEAICGRIAAGELIADICKTKGMPSKPTWFRWLQERADLAHAYALAKQCYAEDIFDVTIRIADECAARLEKDEDASDSAKVRAAKLRIDTRFQKASKLAPRKYGRLLDQAPLALPVFQNGDNAKVVEGVVAPPPPEERDPLYESVLAWDKAARGELP